MATMRISSTGTNKARFNDGPNQLTGRGRVAAPPAPESLFVMDMSADAATVAGWDAAAGEQNFVTIARVAGMGPSGEDGYRFTWIPTATAQSGFGWGTRLGYAVLGNAGAQVGVRWRWRLGAGTNGRFLADGTGDPQESRLKFMTINDNYGPGTTGRPITQLNVRYNGGSPQVRWSQVKGGGDDPINTADTAPPYIAVDTDWHTTQLVFNYSSADGVADGRYRLWVDNTVEGSPTADTGASIILNASDGAGFADEVKLGYYQNNAMASDGVMVLDICEYIISTGFTEGYI